MTFIMYFSFRDKRQERPYEEVLQKPWFSSLLIVNPRGLARGLILLWNKELDCEMVFDSRPLKWPNYRKKKLM